MHRTQTQLDNILDSLNIHHANANRAAESVGVAATTVGMGSPSPAQLRLVAEGLREVQDELQDLGEALRTLAHQYSTEEA